MPSFKNSFLGYKKTQVCEYIDSLVDEITKKHNAETERLREENQQLKKQLEQKGDEKSEVSAVSGIIIEAQRFADELKHKATVANNENIRKNELDAKIVADRIKDCDNKLNMIKDTIRTVLGDTDEKLDVIKKELDEIYSRINL